MGFPPTFRPFLREAAIARSCLGVGLHALSNAHAGDLMMYPKAFFNISIGLERLLKIIYLIDHAAQHSGSYPSNSAMKRNMGHHLERLAAVAAAADDRLRLSGTHHPWDRPDPELTGRIIGCLSEFAASTRYYNIDVLVGERVRGSDPLARWKADVLDYIGQSCPEYLRRRHQRPAELLSDGVFVRVYAEGGDLITSAVEAAYQAQVGSWSNRVAKFTLAAFVRHLAGLLRGLEEETLQLGLEGVPDLHEFFAYYMQDDAGLRRTKVFD